MDEMSPYSLILMMLVCSRSLSPGNGVGAYSLLNEPSSNLTLEDPPRYESPALLKFEFEPALPKKLMIAVLIYKALDALMQFAAN